MDFTSSEKKRTRSESTEDDSIINLILLVAVGIEAILALLISAALH